MSNDNTRRPMSEAELINGLTKPTIPINPMGAMFKETTTNLANFVVDMFANTFGITECDHCVMFPIRNKANQIVDFDLYIYFDTKRGGANPTITRISNKGKAQNAGNGKLDLRGFVGAKMTNGGFKMSDEFKAVFGTVSELDDENRIIVQADPHFPQVATIKCDFFKVIEMCLGISPKDNYDFSIIGCDPVNNRNGDSIDYMLTIVKEINMNGNRRGKTGIDYSISDMKKVRNANKR